MYKLYRKHILKTKSTMRINRKPSVKLEVDQARKREIVIYDEKGEPIKAYPFCS